MKSGSYEFDSFANRSTELGRLSTQASHFIELEKQLLTAMGVPNAQRILEIGCGPGFITNLLAEIAPRSNIVAVDRSHELLSQMPANISEDAKYHVQPAQGSGESLPVRDNWAQFSYARFLLQHVPDPSSIVLEAFRTLSHGGTFLAADSDDGLAIQFPENSQIEELLSAAKQKQREAGGDRNIGRKLPQLLHNAGFKEIQTRVINVTSSDVSIAALLTMALGYKATLTGREETLNELISELSSLAKQGQYFFSTGVVVTTGKKLPVT